VTGLGRVQEKGRRSGARQGSGDLAGDVSRLAHAGDHDPATARKTNAAGVCEFRPKPRRERFDRAGFYAESTPGGGKQLLVIGLCCGAGRGGRMRIHTDPL